MTTNHDLQCQATDREWGDILACRVLPIHPFAGWPWSIGMIPAPNPLDATCILSVEYEHAPKSVITCKASGLEILRPSRGFFRSLDGNYLLFNPRLVATVALMLYRCTILKFGNLDLVSLKNAVILLRFIRKGIMDFPTWGDDTARIAWLFKLSKMNRLIRSADGKQHYTRWLYLRWLQRRAIKRYDRELVELADGSLKRTSCLTDTDILATPIPLFDA